MAVRAAAPHDAEPVTAHGPVTLIRSPHGGAIQAFHLAGLVAAGVSYDCAFVVPHLIGDYVPPGAVLVEVHGGTSAPDPRHVTGLVALGAERTIEQDPAFALRILVDIAIRALSPAVNDPTTAVQVLNHIESFLTVIGSARLRDRYVLTDDRGRPRLVLHGRDWEDYLQLAVSEIRDYGATSTQICRRLRALLDGLLESLPAVQHPAVETELKLLLQSVERAFPDPDRRAVAQWADRQGIGGRSRPHG
jgi:uncharacterized membrane protein